MKWRTCWGVRWGRRSHPSRMTHISVVIRVVLVALLASGTACQDATAPPVCNWRVDTVEIIYADTSGITGFGVFADSTCG